MSQSIPSITSGRFAINSDHLWIRPLRQMFMDLYSDDGGDVKVQMELIKNFFDQSNELLDKYFPDSHLYKQTSHSVSSYLFFYDPDHHYMYKATQSQVMADCIKFYDD